MNRKGLRVLFPLLFPKKNVFFALFFLSVLFGVLDLVLPFFAEHSLDRVFPSKNLQTLCGFAGMVGGFYGAQWGLGLLSSYWNSLLSLEGAKNVRILAHRLSLKNYSENDEKSAIEMAMRIESDALALVHFTLRGMDGFGKNAVALLGSVFLLGFQDLQLLFFCALYFFIQWGGTQIFLKFFFKKMVEIRQTNASVFEMLRDHMSKKRVIALLKVQAFFETQFQKLQERRFTLEQELASWRRLESFLGTLVSFIFKMGIAFYLAKSLMTGTLTAGQGAFLVILLPKFQSYFLQLSGIFRDAKMFQDSLRRLVEILEKKDQQVLAGVSKFRSLEFKKVCFSRGGTQIIRDFSFEIKSGEKVVFHGPSGCGKTTVWLLILGLLLPDSGEILLNGEPLEGMDLSSWQALLSIVPQENELFRLSLDENVSLGREGSFSGQDLTDFFSFKEKRGGRSEVYCGEGATFSTGELRRVVVARGLWSNAPVLLLDEPDAHWDEALADKMKDILFGLPEKTVLVFTHRNSWIQKAEKRIVLGEA